MGLPLNGNAFIMRAFGCLILASLMLFGCVSALDENFEGQTDFTDYNDVSQIPKTEVAEAVLPQTTSSVETQAGTSLTFVSPVTREKRVKKDKAEVIFKKKREEWIKSQKEIKLKRERKHKKEKCAKEKKKKAERHAKERKAKACKKEKASKERKKKEKATKEKKSKA